MPIETGFPRSYIIQGERGGGGETNSRELPVCYNDQGSGHLFGGGCLSGRGCLVREYGIYPGHHMKDLLCI